MHWLAAALLGIVQGLTEFLPVSSSAHLILARAFFGWDAPEFGLAFDVALHVGTLLAIAAYFRAELAAMIAAVPSMFSTRPRPAGRILRLIAIGTIPAIVVGLLFNRYIEDHLRTPFVSAMMLAAVAIVMLVAERVRGCPRDEAQLTVIDAIVIGSAQASALVPGVSRSGSTISAGMLLGVRRDAAARFTFLLAIPAILAAAGKESLELRHTGISSALAGVYVVGIVTSAVVGFLTIKFFLKYLAGHRLDVFAYYRLALAALTFAWLMRS